MLNDLLVALGALVAGLVALGFHTSKRIKEARQADKVKDYENAEAIRNRVNTGLADRVRKLDDAGYRD